MSIDILLTQPFPDTIDAELSARVGRAIAQRAQVLRTPVCYVGPREHRDSGYRYMPDPVALARDGDVLVTVDVLASFYHSGFHINVAYEKLVDEAARVLVLANGASSNGVVIAPMTIAFFGNGLAAVGWAVLADTAPQGMVGPSGGVFNGRGNIAGIVTPLVIGYFVAHTGSFAGTPRFVPRSG